MPEGDTAINPATGERLVLRGGKWVPLADPAQAGAETAKGPSLLGNTRQTLRQGFGSFIANMLSTPHASGKLLAMGGALPALIPGGESYSEARARGEKQFPASAFLAVPDVTTDQVLAAPTALERTVSAGLKNAASSLDMIRNPKATGAPLETMNPLTHFRNAVAEEEQFAADHPIVSSVGRVGGDVASLFTLRPGARLTKLLGGANPRATIPADAGKLEAASRTLQRGLGRTAEAGVDGAVLGALANEDPAATAAWTAGLQAGGSAAMAAKSALLRNPIKSFFGLYLGHEMFKSLAPGPQDLFTSKDSAVNEMVGAYVAGTIASMLGAGRGVGAGNIRAFTDAVSTTSRATIASVVTQLQEAKKDGNSVPAKVLGLMSENPNRFGPEARERLERAAASEEPRALLNEIDALMKDEQFRKALDQTEQGVQNAQSSFGEFLRQRSQR